MARPLAFVGQLAAFTGRPIDESDAAANLYLDIASGMVRDYLNQEILHVTGDVVTLDPIATGPYAVLPEFPITAITTVETWDAASNGWTVRPAGEYVASKVTGLIVPVRGQTAPWPYASGTWRVTYDHGYPEVPPAILGVVLGVAARAYVTPVGVMSEAVGGVQIRYTPQTTAFNPIETAALNRYVHARVA